jgi:hypothetical protein
MMIAAAVSPELVLVDRELREAALEKLPRIEPFDFLRFTTEPRRHSDLDRFDFLAGYGEAETFERVPPVWVAAPVYAVATLAKVMVVDTMVLLVIAGAVALLQVG